MSIFVENQEGRLELSNETIATVVGKTATEMFGVVGMASKNQVRDGISEILKRENYSKGVKVRQEGNSYAVDMYVIIAYGVKISEVCKNVQETVAYSLEKHIGVRPAEINVFVQNVRVVD